MLRVTPRAFRALALYMFDKDSLAFILSVLYLRIFAAGAESFVLWRYGGELFQFSNVARNSVCGGWKPPIRTKWGGGKTKSRAAKSTG